MTDLPPLPHPCIYVTHDTETVYCGDVPRDKVPPHDDFYSADRTREYAAEAIEAANRRASRLSETISVRFDVLHAYAERHRLDYNELCRTVRDAIAEGSVAALSAATGSPGNSDQKDAQP